MVAVITGQGTGLERSSAFVLGSAGQLGSSVQGRGGDNVFVNASSGDLVIQNTDEMLLGLGQDDVLTRTYNSQGTFTANSWQENTQRAVTGLVGTVNTAGSTITRTAADGTVVTYGYNTTLGAYVANGTEGGNGPVDTLTFAGTTWTWHEAATGITETYDSANGGRLTGRADPDGNALTYTYTGSLLTKVTDQDGEFTTLSYTGNNLTQITTTLSGGQTLTRVRYGYDASNRLTSVTVDLSPNDNSITDGAVYTTTYGYDGTSNRVNQITQSDGSMLQIAYVSGISGFKVSSLTQTIGGTQAARVTSFTYNTGSTIVTDPLGQQTTLAYDSNGQVLSIKAPPATTGAAQQVTAYTYNSLGEVLTMVAPSGATTTYTYDANGNQLTAVDPTGDTITRTYDANNLLLTETTTPASGVSQTTRYVYDSHRNLRFVVSAQGDVTEHRYSASGLQTSAISYAGNTFTTSGALTESQLSTWVSGISDLSTTQRTDTTYDFRGNVASVSSYSKVLTSGAGDTTSPTNTVNYVYDQAGNLLSRQRAGAAVAETYVYDGLSRQTLATDLTGATTTVAFNDANNKTVVTLANGTTETSLYDGAGELISTSTSASGVAASTTTYAYDADGRLRMATDATGVNTYYLYDNAGRKVADIAADGSIVEYRYNADNQVVATVQHQNKLTPTQLGTLVVSGAPANVTLASVLPSASAADRWTWNVYDSAGRVLETIDATGAASVFTYDQAGRLTATTSYANFLSATVVAGFKTTPPTAVTLPTADSVHDDTTRDFYDSDGRVIALLDGDGVLTQTTYDAAGEAIRTLVSATAVSAALRATGTLSQLITSAGASSHDETTSYVYDAEGELRYKIDANAQVCEYVYDAAGNMLHQTEYATAITPAATYSLAYVQSHLSANGADRTTRNVYDAANRLVFSIDAAGGVVADSYDSLSRVVKQVAYAALYTASGDPSLATMQSYATTNASAAGNRVDRTIFDAYGRAVYAVDAEGYVTESQYDLAGRVTKQIRYASSYTVGDTTTQAALAAAIGSISATAAVTAFGYDADGRLTDVTDPMGVVTHSSLDALGQVTDQTVAYGTGDAATTHFVYDAAGRVVSQTSAYGAAEATSTSATYDALGHVLTSTDGRGSTTTNSYDAVGQLLSVTAPLDSSTVAVTSYQYDAFGNRVSTTDPRGNTGYAYYDNLNRLVLQVDPEGYITQTAYSRGDQATSVTHYAARATNLGSLSATVPPTIAATGADETTTIGRDKLDRVVSTTDALGFTESYTLDAFGDRLTVTNKIGGTTTNIYDRRGLLTSETLPISSTRADGTVEATSVTNTYSYDARGNRIGMVEASGLTEQRTTFFDYDLNDRLTQKLSAGVISETTKYDARGDVIETDATGGARTLYYYDHLGQKIASVDALGDLSTWAYDANGNMVTATAYGDRVTVPTTPGGAPPGPVGTNQRQTFYTYDLANRLVSTRTPNVFMGQEVGGVYTTTTADVIVQTIYDKDGNVIQQIDARGNSTYSFYDKLGRKVAQVDPDNALTFYTLDADGNVLKEEQFATPLSGTATSASDPNALRASVVSADPTDDRITLFTYDRNGQRLTETRKGVNGIGDGVNAGPDSTVVYTYNGLGEVTLKQQATLDFTAYTYDAGGRQIAATLRGFTDYTGTVVSPQTQTYYDGLNNVTRTRQGASVANAAVDHITTYTYTNGRLATMTDADGNTNSYVYNAAGNLTDTLFFRTTNAGLVYDDVGSTYDALGRVTAEQTQQSGAISGAGDITTMTYDAYGEMINRGMNGLTQETFDYDGAGRLYRTNTNGGVAQLYLYDASGNKTLEVDSTAVTLGAISEANITTVAAAGSAVAATYQVFDGRNEATQIIQKNRQLSSTVTQDLTETKLYDAFGEVSQDTATNGGVTNYYYNTMGKVLEQVGPAVAVTDASGVTTTNYRTITRYGYDVSGRLHTVLSAEGVFEFGSTLTDIQNHYITNQRLVWNTGYDGTAAVTKDTFLPDGVIARGIDVFGNVRTVTNQLNETETYTYDKMNRMLTDAHPMRSAANNGGVAGQLIDTYTYDQLGRQLTHTNNVLGSGVAEKTDYDIEGRVSSEIDYLGHATTYSYAWDSTIATSGMGTFGGWTKVTTTEDGTKQSVDKIDYFGRTVEHDDLGGHDVFMTFDGGGRLVSKAGAPTTGWVGESVAYTYFNTGLVASVADAASAQTTNYGYDAGGDETLEQVTGLSVYYDPSHGCGPGPTTILQSSVATFDAQHRMTSLQDTGRAGGPSANITYLYDANGNVRNIHTTYTDIVSGASNTQDDWYRYDFMNQMVTSKGQLFTNVVGGVTTHSIAPPGDGSGVDITYDAAGERVSATTSNFQVDPVSGTHYNLLHTEYYTYTEDGYLSTVSDDTAAYNSTTHTATVPSFSEATLISSDQRDLMGRVIVHKEWAAGNKATAATTYGWEDPGTGQWESPGTGHYEDDGYWEDIPQQGYWLDPPCDTSWYQPPDQEVWVSNEVYVADPDVWVEDPDVYVATTTYTPPTQGLAVFVKTDTYDADSNVTREDTATLDTNSGTADGTVAVTDETFDYQAQTTPGVWTGAYVGGVMTHSFTRFGTLTASQMASTPISGNLATAEAHWVAGSLAPTTVNTTDAHTDYDFFDLPEQALIYSFTSGAASAITTTLAYNGDGHLQTATIADGRPRTVTYIENVLGEIISRVDSTGPKEFYFNFDGMQRGDVGNNGQSESDVDYASAIAARQNAPSTGPWANGAATNFADFDQNYVPFNPATDAGAASSYTVQSGDSLQSIAQQVWGDSSLWYLIADANGLSGNSTLMAGETLSLPNKVTNFNNTATTFQVYDPNKAVGDVSPSVPIPPPQPAANHSKHSCGIAQVFVAIVAVAVALIAAPVAASALTTALGGTAAEATAAAAAVTIGGSTAGLSATALAGAVAGAAVGGAVGSLVSQGVGIAVGAQSQFSWSAVGLAAIGASVGAGLGAVSGLSGNGLAASFGRGVAGSVISQGIGVATGLQSKFDWTGVAVAGIGSAAGAIAGDWASGPLQQNPFATSIVSGAANLVVGAATRSLIAGTDFGNNVLADLPGVIGNTIGNLVAGGIAAAEDPNGAIRYAGSGLGNQYAAADQGETITSDVSGVTVIGARTPHWYDGLVNAADMVGQTLDNFASHATHSFLNDGRQLWGSLVYAKDHPLTAGKAIVTNAAHFGLNTAAVVADLGLGIQTSRSVDVENQIVVDTRSWVHGGLQAARNGTFDDWAGDQAGHAAFTGATLLVGDGTGTALKAGLTALRGAEVAAGGIEYGALDALGRPTGVNATITQEMIGTGTKANPAIMPPGWSGDGTLFNEARGHLLGAQLGGSGDLAENLVTLQQNPANSPFMRGFENQVRGAVEDGEVVQYSSTPVYSGSNLVPRGITLRATGSGGFGLNVTVLNPPGY